MYLPILLLLSIYSQAFIISNNKKITKLYLHQEDINNFATFTGIILLARPFYIKRKGCQTHHDCPFIMKCCGIGSTNFCCNPNNFIKLNYAYAFQQIQNNNLHNENDNLHNDYNNLYYKPLNNPPNNHVIFNSLFENDFNITMITKKKDISNVSEFLTNITYKNIKNHYKKKLILSETSNLYKIYGQTIGNNKIPSSLFVSYNNDKIIGCIGISYQIFEKYTQKFRNIYPYDFFNITQTQQLMVPIISNLAVDEEYRRQNIGTTLLKYAEKTIKEWNYNKVYLIVERNNIPAIEFYFKNGYNVIINDYKSTHIVYDTIVMKKDSINYVMSKKI